MKTTTLNKYLKFLLLSVTMIGFTSCEVSVDSFFDSDDLDDEYYYRTEDLCSRTWATEYWVDAKFFYEEIDFYMDRTGVDYFRVEYPNGKVERFEHYFTWHWDNRDQTTIRMSYSPDDVSYFDNIYLNGNTLSGYIDGTYLKFRGLK